jgi:hypothetical protein
MLLPRMSGRSRNLEKRLELDCTALFSMVYIKCGRLTGRCALLRSLLAIGVLVLSIARPMQSQEPAASTAHPMPTDAPTSALFRKVLENQKRMDLAMEQFQRTERTEIRKVGNTSAPSEVKVYRVFPAGTGMDKLLLSPDGKPVNTQSYIAELEKLEKALVWAAQRGTAQEEAYAKAERKRKERNELLDATHEAFIFTRVGEELRGDRKLIKYTLVPNPNYKATTRNTMIFQKVRGTVWIDEATSQLARIDGYVTEDISIALFVARVYKGSHFMQERYEVEPGLWLPSFQQYDFDGRKFFVSIAIHERTFFTNYQRVGPPGEAVATVRAELGKLKASPADP